MRQKKMVIVRWRDAVHEFGWLDDGDDAKDSQDMCVSIGFVLKSTAKVLRIAMTLGEDDGEVAQTLQIPRGMIEEIRDLTVGEKAA